ncbi:hypothetical protein ADL00_00865 [Streptomyces sp. AS58]|uniref:CU044_5270 family protein n=1 Tax=Streptomyces sp. AS58 TaxID=1519489 RepID=UPI0006AE8EC5|nr:CU044_5270 family protein [Streptomyces sp. AS58]KOV74869.1 hypothetical protein ADL00_00865 [Streptomyces sp. AS58]
MNSAEREELTRLLPSPADPKLPPGRMLQLEENLVQEIARQSAAQAGPQGSGAPEHLGSRPSPFRGRRGFRLGALPVGLAAAVVGAVVVAGLDTGQETPRTDEEAVVMLNRIATVAAAQEATPVRDDQYVFTQVQGTQQIMDDGEDVFRRSNWHSADGNRRGLARITVLSGPSGEGTRDMSLAADPNATSYRELQALPTDPDQLYDMVWKQTEGQGPTHEEAALEHIGSMLPGATLLPQLDAALYRAAARIPGVTLVQHAEDAAGREGIGFAFGSGDDRDVWVFDRNSLEYLGSDDVALLKTGVADALGEAPTD